MNSCMYSEHCFLVPLVHPWCDTLTESQKYSSTIHRTKSLASTRFSKPFGRRGPRVNKAPSWLLQPMRNSTVLTVLLLYRLTAESLMYLPSMIGRNDMNPSLLTISSQGIDSRKDLVWSVPSWNPKWKWIGMFTHSGSCTCKCRQTRIKPHLNT